jgi:DMSO/TMAO reductase YedYZ heme-binding membrane subunit
VTSVVVGINRVACSIQNGRHVVVATGVFTQPVSDLHYGFRLGNRPFVKRNGDALGILVNSGDWQLGHGSNNTLGCFMRAVARIAVVRAILPRNPACSQETPKKHGQGRGMTPELQLIQGQGGNQSAVRPNLVLVPPTGRVRLGERKMLKLKRSQDFVEILAWTTVVAVVAMFLIDGAVAQVTDVASALGAFSRLTALLATDLLLIHMLLIARVPWIDRLYGHDRATEAHKKLGKPILYLVIAHFLASTIGYAITDGKNAIDELIFLIGNVPDMLTATISLALMIVVVVTSIKIARKKLSYEAWYIIHLVSYASVLLAIPHQFSTFKDLRSSNGYSMLLIDLN